MTTGLTASANTYFVGLEDALGSVEGPVTTAKAMGMHFDGPRQLAECQNKCDDWGQYAIDNQLGSFTLGTIATSPLDLADSYATIAAQGTHCDPTPVTAILDRNGKPLTDDKGKVIDTSDHCTPNALAPGVANTLANMMVHVVEDGTGRKAAVPGVPIAGKTGTIQGDKSATFVGITPTYAVSVMYFNPKAGEDVGGHGGGIPAQIFNAAMTPILTSEQVVPFPPSDPAVAAGTKGQGYVAPPPPPPPAPEPAPTEQPPAAPTDGNSGNGDGNNGGDSGNGDGNGGH
jgi:membrane peptidoglycan carboxypeptidase